MIAKNAAFFVGSLFLGALFFWGTNALRTLPPQNSQLLAAEIPQEKPLQKVGVLPLQLNSRAALSMFFSDTGKSKILFEKDKDTPFPIASVTKVMTALVAVEHYQPNDAVQITQKAVDKEENIGNFKAGERITVDGLLNSMLIESSNDAAEALAGVLGDQEFLRLMNERAQQLGLSNMYFADVAGVDPDKNMGLYNIASSSAIAQLAEYVITNRPEIAGIMGLKGYDLFTAEGTFHHRMANTNEMAGYPGAVFGKTGWTPLSKGNLVLALKVPEGYVVNVVLGSDDRFKEMKQLSDWVSQSYDF